MIGRRIGRGGGMALTGDTMMGVAGGCLAVASASFGLYMTVRGPAPDFGKSHDFTVFAQLAPRAPTDETMPAAGPAPARQAARPAAEDLDLTSTASIPKAATPDNAGPVDAVIPALSVEVATGKAATIRIDGRVRIVHVGDSVPGAGDVVAIVPGIHPTVRTTRGTIISRDDD